LHVGVRACVCAVCVCLFVCVCDCVCVCVSKIEGVRGKIKHETESSNDLLMCKCVSRRKKRSVCTLVCNHDRRCVFLGACAPVSCALRLSLSRYAGTTGCACVCMCVCVCVWSFYMCLS
jgi:hypothetical protein